MSSRRMNIAVILGGASNEREVSIKSGRAVIRALNAKKYRVMVFDPVIDLGRLMKTAPQLDAAMIMLHGRYGEDGTVQGLLDLLDVPYQCAGVLGSSVAMNKILSKDLYRQAGIPVAKDLVLKLGEEKPLARIRSEVGIPCVVKPANEGSSVGVTIVQRDEDLKDAVARAFKVDNHVLVEQFLMGKEVTASVLGNSNPDALPLIEIRPGEGYEFFDYEAKYKPGATAEICPAPIDERSRDIIQELAVRAHEALYLKGYSRTDFILTQEGPVALETNTIPGFTKTSLFPQAAAEAGITFPRLLDRLIELALKSRNKPI